VVEQARRALSQPAYRLEPGAILPIQVEGVELGVVVSLTVAEPGNTVGGGGLVWVDIETGCSIVLRRYE
jgi:hypothetical protein